MKQISELQKILSYFLDWNKPRVNCLVQIIQALFTVRTVNLTQIATAFQSDVKEESSYRRICRFFTHFSFDLSAMVLLILRLFPLGGGYLLVLDRTNWKWGKTPINILMLSVAYKGISIPLCWRVLDLAGNSCLQDRIDILRRVLKRLDPEKIQALLADREFVGKEWFDFLIAQKIPFLIRIKKNSQISLESNVKLAAGRLRKCLKIRKVINYPVDLWGCNLYLSIERRRGAKEPIIIVSNIVLQNPFLLYRRRWEIETLFGCLKSRGFNMEDTHITDPDKIEKLLFVLAIAFCWAYRMGDIQDKVKPIEIKKHKRKARSLFRVGMDLIRRAFFNRVCLRKFRSLLTCFNISKPVSCVL